MAAKRHPARNRGPKGIRSWARYPLPKQLDSSVLDRARPLPPDGPVVLDLGATVFIKPLGMAALYWIVRRLRDAGRPVHLTIGHKQVATYLCRMNFHKGFAKDRRVTFSPDLRSTRLHRARLRKQLMEFTIVRVDSDDAVEQAALRLISIVQSKAPFFAPISDQMFTAIAELLSNVERHSGVHEACVVAQTHEHRVRIAVGDNGCGIRVSLARTRGAEIAPMTDEQVNFYATKPGISGSPFGGGYGLTTIANAVRTGGEVLHILSGEGRCSIWRRRDTVRPLGLGVAGTLVEVSLARSEPRAKQASRGQYTIL